jgi:hypothetical protein
LAPPAICLNNTGSSLWVAAIGLNNQVWTTSQPLGAPSWPAWTERSGFGTGPLFQESFSGDPVPAPSCAATANGNVVVGYVDKDAHPDYTVFNNQGITVHGWSEDLVSQRLGWQTVNAIQLSSDGNIVWSLFTGQPGTGGENANTVSTPVSDFSGYSYWKQLYVAP